MFADDLLLFALLLFSFWRTVSNHQKTKTWSRLSAEHKSRTNSSLQFSVKNNVEKRRQCIDIHSLKGVFKSWHHFVLAGLVFIHMEIILTFTSLGYFYTNTPVGKVAIFESFLNVLNIFCLYCSSLSVNMSAHMESISIACFMCGLSLYMLNICLDKVLGSCSRNPSHFDTLRGKIKVTFEHTWMQRFNVQ